MNIITSSINRILNTSAAETLTALLFGNSCCGDVLAPLSFGAFCGEKKYPIKFTDSPKQADVLICSCSVNVKSASMLKNIYNQMPKPKYVIALGACACSGGIFFCSYAQNQGIDSILPVDIYVPGCPIAPEALLDAIQKLKDKIKGIDAPDIKIGENPSSDCDMTVLAGVKDRNDGSLGVVEI